ncbi:hypothetical protein CVT24_009678 [Panaeolus cyanescens]|uniref:F-box domain-containing protein n=1 Tax=Panaeolus cyanescens TaxID=181874 RepID=A0A409Y9W6_9AGAR|nr:hypothetical protein CVT24_009678 [Panaeolus cyanescens]
MSIEESVLPAELILQVMGHLHDVADKNTLLSFSLLGKIFQKDAQRRLFSSVELQYAIANPSLIQDVSTKAGNFLRTLNDNPKLAEYVHSFTLCLLDWSGWSVHFRPGATVYTILPQLTHLSTFSITGTSKRSNDVYWSSESLPVKLLQLVEMTLRTRNIESLSLTAPLIFPTNFIASCLTLKNLTLSTDSFRFPLHAVSPDIQAGPPIYLTSLVLQTGIRHRPTYMADFIAFFNPLLCPLSLSRLTCLDISGCKASFLNNLLTLLSICPHDLQTLVLPIPPGGMFILWSNLETLLIS